VATKKLAKPDLVSRGAKKILWVAAQSKLFAIGMVRLKPGLLS
jgi:hypothetical protein